MIRYPLAVQNPDVKHFSPAIRRAFLCPAFPHLSYKTIQVYSVYY